MHDSSPYRLIRASGLFDPIFYRKTYGHALAGGKGPLQHFLMAGLAQGNLASATFDPALYRVLVPECGDANPLLHSHASGAPFRPPPLPEVFPGVAARITFRLIHDNRDIERHRAYARDAAAARAVPLDVDGCRYALRIPEPESILERIRSDQTFACARVPEGFWYAAWMLETAESGIAADPRARRLHPLERRALATRLCAAVRRNYGAFAPSFIDEVLADIPAYADRPDFLRAVSFQGYPTADEDVFGNRAPPFRDAVLRQFAQHFRSDETVYDATLWKRLLIAGYLRELPTLCRDRPVVLVASRFFASLPQRWRLTAFRHVLIPPRLSQWQRWTLLERTARAVAEACAAGGRPPVLLMQCGGSLAFWLITRLYARFPRVFYLDLGQALNGWFFDVGDIPAQEWMKLYTRAVIENCALEPYYRDLKGAAYEEWFNGLP